MNGITPCPSAPPAETIPIARPRLRANQNVVTLVSGTMIAPKPSSPISACHA